MTDFIINDPTMRLHVVVDGVDITEDITSYKKSGQYMTDGVFCLGNAPSVNINLTLINKGGKYNKLIDSEFYIYEQMNGKKVNVGYFYVFEKPEKYTEVMELTLNDGMRGLGVPYNSQLTYPAQLISQLNEIAQMTGYPIAPLPPEFLSFSSIGFYDNTYTIRQYLAWIAEMNGCNVWINRDKQIEFKPVDKNKVDYVLPMEMLGDLEDEQVLYKVSEVFFDNGVNVWAKGDKTAFSLQLSGENLYILDQTVVDKIYDKVGNLTLNSLSNIKVKGNPSVNLGDVISLVNNMGVEVYKFMVLEIEETQNMNSCMQILNGTIETEEAQRTVDVINNNQKIKKVQTIVNQQEARLDIIAQEVNGIDDKIQGQLTVAKGEILGEVSQTYLTKDEFNTGIDGVADEVIGRIDLDSKLQVTSNSILQEVSGKYETIEGHDKDTRETNAKFELYVDKKNMISYINASADVITLNSNRLEVNSDKFKLAADGTLEAVNGKFSGDIFGSTITFGDLSSKYVVMKPHVKVIERDQWGNPTKTEITGADIEGNGGIHITQQGDFIELVSKNATDDIVNEVSLSATRPSIFIINKNNYGEKANQMFLIHDKSYRSYTDEQGQKVWYSRHAAGLENYQINEVNKLSNYFKLLSFNDKGSTSSSELMNYSQITQKSANQALLKSCSTYSASYMYNYHPTMVNNNSDGSTKPRMSNMYRLYSTDNSSFIDFWNYHPTESSPYGEKGMNSRWANLFKMNSTSTRNEIELANQDYQSANETDHANYIHLISAGFQNGILFDNRDHNLKLANNITINSRDDGEGNMVDICNYGETGALANRFVLSSKNDPNSQMGGISLNNWRDAWILQSQFRMDRAGNINLQCQNSVNIESENYNIYLRADTDSSHNNVGSGSVIIQAPKGLWVNGKKIA